MQTPTRRPLVDITIFLNAPPRPPRIIIPPLPLADFIPLELAFDDVDVATPRTASPDSPTETLSYYSERDDPSTEEEDWEPSPVSDEQMLVEWLGIDDPLELVQTPRSAPLVSPETSPATPQERQPRPLLYRTMAMKSPQRLF
jgi:hypothetical protein